MVPRAQVRVGRPAVHILKAVRAQQLHRPEVPRLADVRLLVDHAVRGHHVPGVLREHLVVVSLGVDHEQRDGAAPLRQEAREAAEEKMTIHAEYAKGLTGEIPVLFVREGDTSDELLALIDEEPSISLLVLGADTQSETTGPLISFLMSRGASRCRVPITVVPGNLSDEQLDALF